LRYASTASVLKEPKCQELIPDPSGKTINAKQQLKARRWENPDIKLAA
jgi:hypothetical protein